LSRYQSNAHNRWAPALSASSRPFYCQQSATRSHRPRTPTRISNLTPHPTTRTGIDLSIVTVAYHHCSAAWSCSLQGWLDPGSIAATFKSPPGPTCGGECKLSRVHSCLANRPNAGWLIKHYTAMPPLCQCEARSVSSPSSLPRMLMPCSPISRAKCRGDSSRSDFALSPSNQYISSRPEPCRVTITTKDKGTCLRPYLWCSGTMTDWN
jgi:hypothetical protein